MDIYYKMPSQVTIKLYAGLDKLIPENQKEVNISGENVKKILEKLSKQSSDLEQKLFKKNKQELRENVNIMVNGRNIKFLKGQSTTLKKGDEIAIFPTVAGG